MKRKEEILGEIQVMEMATFTSNEMFVILMAMEEYGKQEHNEAILKCVDKVVKFYGEQGLTATGNRIRESMLKMLTK